MLESRCDVAQLTGNDRRTHIDMIDGSWRDLLHLDMNDLHTTFTVCTPPSTHTHPASIVISFPCQAISYSGHHKSILSLAVSQPVKAEELASKRQITREVASPIFQMAHSTLTEDVFSSTLRICFSLCTSMSLLNTIPVKRLVIFCLKGH